MAIRPVLTALLIVCAASAPAASDWLPPQAEEAAARELARGMAGLEGDVPPDPAARLEGARRGIRQIVERLEGWGVDGVLERTPSIPALELPPTKQPILASIASWGGCALPLYEELAGSAKDRLYVILSNVSVAIVSAYLRHAFLEGGGTDAELKAYLASDEMNAVSGRVVQDPDLRATVNAQCGPGLASLLGR